MKRLLVALASLLIGLEPKAAQARAVFEVIEHGAGFDDETPVEPLGGNEGTTLGEQRHLALEYALELWSRYLDSPVPIEVDVEFSSMGCGEGVVLGQAGVVDMRSVEPDAPELLYPIALANSLAGEDLEPSRPDIRVRLNSAPDDACLSRTGGFYYGLDGQAGDANDFVDVVIHELAHGLGFSSHIDPATGHLVDNGIDVFSAQLFDLDLQRSWLQLSAAERAASATKARRLVWQGPAALRAAVQALPLAQPQLSFDPEVQAFSGLVADASIGLPLAQTGVSGPVVLAQRCEVTPRDRPDEPFIALFNHCEAAVATRAAVEAGAAAVLVSSGASITPPLPYEASSTLAPLAIPVLVLTQADARSIQLAYTNGPLTAQLHADPAQRLGTDAEGRPFMFASDPVLPGSSVSHVDPSSRPNQLMEPFATDRPSHDLALTSAFLRDIGWPSRCGNGVVDPGEACDLGPRNDDHVPDGCRTDCRLAHCGDGVLDNGEQCDDGLGNSDRRPGACRSDCRRARCGDGVTDEDLREQCDDGAHNDDHARDGCRTSCRRAFCGDGVLDGIEQCDDGANNSDERVDACRTDCRLARCGDAVLDQGEACDQGPRNGRPDGQGCRSDCTQASDDDGIVDDEESCDASADCGAWRGQTASMRPDAPRTTFLDAASLGGAAGADAIRGSAVRRPQARAQAEPGGCGCRSVGDPPRARHRHGRVTWPAAATALVVWLRRRRVVRTRIAETSASRT